MYEILPFVVDIETIPAQDPAIIEDINTEIERQKESKLAAIRAKYAKEETIAKHSMGVNLEFEEKAADAWLKTSFDGARGSACVISWKVGDNDTRSVAMSSIDEAGEKEMLKAFWEESSAEIGGNRVIWVGHNIIQFDIPFIFKRMLKHKLSVPEGMTFPLHDRHGRNVFDTMFAFSGWGKFSSMNEVCRLIGIDGKEDDIDGSRVWEYVLAGDIGKVREYCEGDVNRTYEMYRAMKAVLPD